MIDAYLYSEPDKEVKPWPLPVRVFVYIGFLAFIIAPAFCN